MIAAKNNNGQRGRQSIYDRKQTAIGRTTERPLDRLPVRPYVSS